jgi:hypothetical protein
METTSRPPIPFSPRLVIGLLIMAFGVMLTLDNLGFVDAGRWWRLWPVILIGAGIARMREASRCGKGNAGAVLIVVGSILLIHNLGWLRMKHVWPLFLLAVGATLVWKAIKGTTGGAVESPAGGESLDRLDASIIVGGISRANRSQTFQGGSATAVMGGAEIDLRGASISGGPVVFDTFAMWGGIEIKVPPDWVVEGRVLPFLGGFADHTHPVPLATKRLVITGMAVMGGIEVKN